MLKLILRSLFSLLLVAGLGFGGMQALAGSATGTTATGICDWPPWHGECETQQECQDICEGIYPPPPPIYGDCESNGCCACFQR